MEIRHEFVMQINLLFFLLNDGINVISPLIPRQIIIINIIIIIIIIIIRYCMISNRILKSNCGVIFHIHILTFN